MEKPRFISSSEAMRWNADVEQRRRAYHEMRCSKDPIYRRAYERRQEMMQRMQKMHDVTMAQLANAMNENEITKCQKVLNQMDVSDQPQRLKTHEEVIRDQAIVDSVIRNPEQFPLNEVGCGLGLAVASTLLADGDSLKQRLKEMQEEIPYADEIRRTDARFDKELIRMSGFEW